MNVISLDAERRKRINRIVDALNEVLRHGSLNDPVIAAALECLSDDELEALHRARAKAALDRAKST